MYNLKLIASLLLIAFVWHTAAQGSSLPQEKYTVFFGFDQWQIATNSQREELSKVVGIFAKKSNVRLAVTGWADTIGSKSYNQTLTALRATSVYNYFVSNRINKKLITMKAGGIDYTEQSPDKARRVEIEIILKGKKNDNPTRTEPEDALTAFERDTLYRIIIEQLKAEAIVEASKQTDKLETKTLILNTPKRENILSLRTNLLYWAVGILNLGVEYKPLPMVGILVNGGYAPWVANQWEHHWGGWFIAPEIRVYLGDQLRWFTGVQFLATGYNIKPANIGYQGTLLAGGIIGGYKLPINKHIEIDFSIGVGYGELKYDTYERYTSPITNIRKNVYIQKNIVKYSVIPVQAGISLIWKII